MPAEQAHGHALSDDTEFEIDQLVVDHGSERAVIRALLHEFDTLVLDAHGSISRGLQRGRFTVVRKREDDA